MSLHRTLEDYLTMRRSLGYKLEQTGKQRRSGDVSPAGEGPYDDSWFAHRPNNSRPSVKV